MTKKIPFSKLQGFEKYAELKGLIKDDSILERKYVSAATFEPITDAQKPYTVSGIFSTMDIDADGDVLIPTGCDTSFYNGVGIYGHKLESETLLPIFRVPEVKVDSTKVFGDMVFAAEEYAFAMDCFRLASGGYLRGISVGFFEKRSAVKGERAYAEAQAKYGFSNECQRVILDWFLIEISLVSVACNRACLVTGLAEQKIQITDERTKKEFGLDDYAVKALVGMQSKLADAERDKDALQTQVLEAKALTAGMTVKAAVDPASLKPGAWIAVTAKAEESTATKLADVWAQLPKDIDPANIDSVVDPIADQADKIIEESARNQASSLLKGYENGFSGQPIKDYAKTQDMLNQKLNDYLATLKPDGQSHYQSPVLDQWKQDYIKASEAGTALPDLAIVDSNLNMASMGTFGAAQDLVAKMQAEIGNGLVQVITAGDSSVCPECAKWDSEILTTMPGDSKFKSVQDWKDAGGQHPRCRCLITPVDAPDKPEDQPTEAKAIEVPEVKEVKPVFKLLRLGPATVDEAIIAKKALLMRKGVLV